MNVKLEYITDKNGKKKAVVIPRRDRKTLMDEHSRLKNKLKVVLGINDALNEVKEIRSGKRKGKTLKTLLNEL